MICQRVYEFLVVEKRTYLTLRKRSFKQRFVLLTVIQNTWPTLNDLEVNFVILNLRALGVTHRDQPSAQMCQRSCNVLDQSSWEHIPLTVWLL